MKQEWRINEKDSVLLVQQGEVVFEIEKESLDDPERIYCILANPEIESHKDAYYTILKAQKKIGLKEVKIILNKGDEKE